MLKVNKQNYEYGVQPSAIRELYNYGLKRKRDVGEDNIFDFSIGNPNISLPDFVLDALRECVSNNDFKPHAYSENSGFLNVRQAIAKKLTKDYQQIVSPDRILMTCGAAAAISISLSAIITENTDEVIVIAPYFPEYKVWIENAGGTCVSVLADQKNFCLDISAIKSAINEHTRAVIINSPNNPTGAVYSNTQLKNLADVLNCKSEDYNKPIYLISDEPYRDLSYDTFVPFIPPIYKNTIVCYSLSKTFSIPGERIGYAYVNDLADYSKELYTALLGSSRAQGYVCAPTMFQNLFLKCYDKQIDISPYEKNRKDIMKVLDRAGFEYVKPMGAFYIWVKAPDRDEQKFCRLAKERDLLIVPSTSFGVKNWARLGFCVSNKTIKYSARAFMHLAKEEYNIYV